MAVRLREQQKQPAFCTSSSNKFAAFHPLRGSSRQAAKYDQKTDKYEYVDTCFNADHNMFDANNNIYFGMNGAVGWIDVNAWDKTHDAEASQGWCPAVLDTNADGKITQGCPISRSIRRKITASSSAATRWPSIPRTAACGAQGSDAARSA